MIRIIPVKKNLCITVILDGQCILLYCDDVNEYQDTLCGLTKGGQKVIREHLKYNEEIMKK